MIEVNAKTQVNKNKNKLKILIIVAVSLLLIVAMAISWVETYWYYVDKVVFTTNPALMEKDDRITVKFNEEYTQKIKSGEITVEDFDHSNLLPKIEIEDDRYIVFFLENEGVRNVKKAIMYFELLDYVEYATYYAQSIQFQPV